MLRAKQQLKKTTLINYQNGIINKNNFEAIFKKLSCDNQKTKSDIEKQLNILNHLKNYFQYRRGQLLTFNPIQIFKQNK
jgi:hypothetical protein